MPVDIVITYALRDDYTVFTATSGDEATASEPSSSEGEGNGEAASAVPHMPARTMQAQGDSILFMSPTILDIADILAGPPCEVEFQNVA
jgi:hypothetical protein